MPDITTPTAAEVMGFTDGHRMWVVDDDCTLCGAPPERWKVEYCPNGAEQPTPDDMLAWLAGRDDIEAIESWADAGGCTVKVWFPFQSWPNCYDASTIHAALELAVIAVGRAE